MFHLYTTLIYILRVTDARPRTRGGACVPRYARVKHHCGVPGTKFSSVKPWLGRVRSGCDVSRHKRCYSTLLPRVRVPLAAAPHTLAPWLVGPVLWRAMTQPTMALVWPHLCLEVGHNGGTLRLPRATPRFRPCCRARCVPACGALRGQLASAHHGGLAR